MTRRVFDRLVHFDDRSKDYPIRTLIAGKSPRAYTWRHIQLDQGEEGACTGFSATMEAAARPVPVFGDPAYWAQGDKKSPGLHRIAREIYHRAREIDEWEGEDYEGSSVLAATQASQERGWWTEYRWALGPGAEAAANDVILAIGYKGPVMMGSWWYENMLEPDSDGFLHATGEIVGGHAWLLTSYSKKKDAVWTPNSWGGEGQGWLSRADLITLLDNEGEACIPVVRKRPR